MHSAFLGKALHLALAEFHHDFVLLMAAQHFGIDLKAKLLPLLITRQFLGF
jgi:hypothetical protein